ncbi:MAG: hypothetical protein U9R75_12570, partial [Candidatus Thermoplasmatota archaeon]|nr:hypothetical protein [Candidatus Thermoplasmatota archaeon]
MNRRSVFLVSLILIAAPMLIVPIQMSGEEVFVPDPVFDPDAGVDVPTWRVGDFWNYSTEFEITYLTFNIPFSGWMNMSVLTATLDFTYGNSPVYIVNITGNITGKIDIPFLGIHERIYVDLSGYAWHRIQDLSIYRMVTNATISGTQDSLNGDYPFGYEYHPPLEEFDFPLIPGETWNVNVSARTPFGTSGDLIDIDQNYTCSSIEPVTVPAGVFDCYPVNMGGSSVQFYNNTLGNSVKRSLSVDAGGMTINAPFELENYHREPEETVIWTWISSDQPVWAGEQFTINGRLSISNTAVTILFPNGEIAAVKTLIGGQKEFTHTLTSPTDPDNTPTDMDHGSFGILSVVGAMQELDVCTITTKAVDL